MNTETEETQSQPQSQPQSRITGRVKWFNNKAGFGFVTACEGVLKDKDIFVHYSSIKVPDDQYKYLVQGEYVDFELTESTNSEHEFHAVNISGVKGGNLMCETRSKTLEAKPYKPRVYKTPDERDMSGPKSTVRRDTELPKKKYTDRPASKREVDADGFKKIPVRREKSGSVSK